MLHCRSFFLMFLLKDSIFEEPRTRNAPKMHRRQFCYMINSFWWPSRNPALEIMALCFFSAYHFTPRSADVILVQAEATKSFAISLTYMLDHFH